jgi:chromosome segregation ATPase
VSTERQEPKISLAIDQDDIVHPTASKSSTPPPVKLPESDGGGGGGFVMFMLTILILALSGASYYLYDQSIMVKKQLKASQARLDTLEQRLSVADESMTQSSATAQVRLKELDSEVRKLWDNVWKKQKEELAVLDVSLTGHKAELDKAIKRLATQEARTKISDDQLAKFMKTYAAERESLTSMAGKVDRVIAQAEVNRKQLLDMSKQVASGGGLDARVKDLERRITQNEEWLDSINAFRRQINRDIESMRVTISQYHSGSPAPR